MVSRQGQGNDWNPMQDDFDDTHYDAQYGDNNNDNGALVELDDRRLYITHIPSGLTEDGLRAAFVKYGTLTDVFMNSDPAKRYALVSFETAGEAKLAMTKLNKTAPLNLSIQIAHKQKKRQTTTQRDTLNTRRTRDRDRDDSRSVDSRERMGRRHPDRSHCENVTMDDLPAGIDDDLNLQTTDPDLLLELDQVKMQKLRLQQAQLELRERMLLRQAMSAPPPADRRTMSSATRCVLPGGRVVLRNTSEGISEARDPNSFIAGAGDSNDRDCTCQSRAWDEAESSDDGSSTPSTCKHCSCNRTETRRQDNETKYKKDVVSKNERYFETNEAHDYDKFEEKRSGRISFSRLVDRRSDFRHDDKKSERTDLRHEDNRSEGIDYNRYDQTSGYEKTDYARCDGKRNTERHDYTKYDIEKRSTYEKTDLTSKKSVTSKTTDMTNKKFYYQYSECNDKITKTLENAANKLEATKRKLKKHRSEDTCDLKYIDFCSDSEDEADETNRLIQLRNSDYLDIDDHLKVVVALAGYPKSKIRLRHMESFQKCVADIIDMQLKSGLVKKVPTFVDYYLNRGAIVCICKDVDTRDWMVRISPGLQERMSINLILLKSKMKRLCLAVLKIPERSWPESAQDAFKLLQYFNPALKTASWKIYAQKVVDNIECTSFIIDRFSGEIIRGPTFKNVIDYTQLEFELTGYTEIYYECLLSGQEDLSSVASRVQLLEDLKSGDPTPRNRSTTSLTRNKKNAMDSYIAETREPIEEADEVCKETLEVKSGTECSLQRDALEKQLDVKYISARNEVIIWSDEMAFSDQEEKGDQVNMDADYFSEERKRVTSTSGVAVSEKTESIYESNDNLTLRNSNLNIDSNRGIAYHRRTNYLHVENELKVAITLEGYPQNKLEGTHIRRMKHLFKEYLHKDMKNQRFANLIIPKFQDIYLSNGAVIYICDSLETKDYLTEVLPKFINSTGLKLTFRDVKNLVRYTRIVMRLPKEHAHVESVEVLLKLQAKYPKLKPECWKYYSDVAGKQKRQFGVEPESLEVIKSPNFDPTYEGDKISFRIIDRQKRDVSFEEPTTNDKDLETADSQTKKMQDTVVKSMYVAIDPEIMNTPLTRIRTNHYSDVIPDDLKLYVGPSNYPESRIDDPLFHSIKRTIENIVREAIVRGEMNDDSVPKFHDMYLFDGVIFIICQSMQSRHWIEKILPSINSKVHIQLKCTEFRGAVGIISLVVKTDKDVDEIIDILQKQNPRLRTKYWRKISTVRTKTKLDAVLQIDKLSAQVMISENFNRHIGSSPVKFKLGHLQSMIKPKASLEELTKKHAKKLASKPTSEIKLKSNAKSKVSIQGPKDATFEQLKEELKKKYPSLRVEDWNVITEREKGNHKVSQLEIDDESAKVIQGDQLGGGDEFYFYSGLESDRSEDPILETDLPMSVTNLAQTENEPSDAKPQTVISETGNPDRKSSTVLPDTNGQNLHKMILKIPKAILPDNKEDLSIIFDLLEDKNPGLSTELWQVYTDSPYPSNGKFTLLTDKLSTSIIQGKTFDPIIGGEKLRFFF